MRGANYQQRTETSHSREQKQDLLDLVLVGTTIGTCGLLGVFVLHDSMLWGQQKNPARMHQLSVHVAAEKSMHDRSCAGS